MMYHHGPNATGGRGLHQTANAQSPISTGPTADPVLINRPIPFSSGQFAGETIRYELKEIQKACLGRKYARVDRRPLDPPPVVLVHIWRFSPETGKEEEVNYEELQTHGLLCTVDLFPVPAKNSKDSPPSSTSTIPRTPKTIQTNDGFVHFNPSGPSPTPSLSPSPSYRPQSYGPSDIVHYYEGGFPLLERSKTTHALVGATFVQPVLVELFGKKCIVFVFSDLAVKSEGTFTLRYRIFDLFSPNIQQREPSQSPPGPYPSTPSSLSISPTPSPTSASGFPPFPPNYPQSSSLTRASHSHYQHSQLQPHFQSHPSQPTQQTSMNPYPDPSHDYTAPPPMAQQQTRRRPQEPEENLDYHAVFAPYEVQTRIEPSERDASLSILAECWAKGSFRIFSTKEFPGLPASTDLTKQLARWGVRLNIRETERKRRRRSMIDAPQEEEYLSDGEVGDGVDTAGSSKDQRPPPRKTANIKPRPLPTQSSQSQMDYRSSPSTSPTQAPQQRRVSSPSPTSALGYDRYRPRRDSEGDEDHEEELPRKPDPGQGAEMMDCDESSTYTHPVRLRSSPRSSANSGLPAYQTFTYSSASASFDPALSSPLAHNQIQSHSSTSPIQTHHDYGVSVQPPMHHTPFTHSGMRSSLNNAGLFEEPHNAPTDSTVLSRYGSSARKRDSDGGSSTTSRRSGGSVGSTGEFQGIAPSFVYGVNHGMGGGHQA